MVVARAALQGHFFLLHLSMSQMRNWWLPSRPRTPDVVQTSLSVPLSWLALKASVQRTLPRLILPSSGPGCSPAQGSWVCRAPCQTSRAGWLPRAVARCLAFIPAFHAVQRFCIDQGNGRPPSAPRVSCKLPSPSSSILPLFHSFPPASAALRIRRLCGVAPLLGKACNEEGKAED